MHQEKIFFFKLKLVGVSHVVSEIGSRRYRTYLQPVRKRLSPNYLAVVPGACWLSLGETGCNEGATMKTSY